MVSQTPTSILSRQLNVYTLPKQLLDALEVRSIQAQSAPEDSVKPQEPETAPVSTFASSSGLGCQACPGASFETPEEQREHFKSDWHRYNVKAKLNGKAVTADQWDEMVEGISSLSGSASDSSSGSSTRSRVTRLLNKASITDKAGAENGIDSDEEAELEDLRRRAHLRTAVIWFSTPNASPSLNIPTDTQIGVYRALFPSFDSAGDYLGELKRLQLTPPGPPEEERRIALLMVAGGHFAGIVVGIRARGKSEKQDVKGAGEVRVLRHKTFHRYTTRRKQGGSQGLNDNAKGKANSAGAMLRRYGEQALMEDIRGLLAEWADDIHACERIFLRASTHGKKSFWGYDGAILEKSDPRLRSFPFPTRRPTLQELLRCWNELVNVKVSHLSTEALAAQDEAYMAQLQPKRPAVAKPVQAPAPAAPAVPKLSPEEEAKLDRQRRLADMIKKGRLDALRQFVEKYRPEVTQDALAQAVTAGQEEIIRYFILEAKFDPAQPIEEGSGKRAYDLASTKAVRNLFRRIAYDNPGLYDWTAAHVPSGLSEEAAAEQAGKKAERRKGLRDKMREREKVRAEAAAAQEAEEEAQAAAAAAAAKQQRALQNVGIPSSGPQKLGGKVPGSSLAGLSPEMRQQIERERRARAAEARFANLGRQ